MLKRLALVALVVAAEAVVLPMGRLLASDVFSVIDGTVGACEVTAERVFLQLKTDGGTSRAFQISDAGRTWPSDSLRKLVVSGFRREGQPPNIGARVEVTYRGPLSAPVVLGVEVIENAAQGREQHSRLWIVRQYFDEVSGAEHMNLTVASMLMSRHNVVDGENRTLWLRDRLGHALDTYRNKERADEFIGEFGHPDLLRSVGPVCAIYRQYGERTGLVKGLPFRPRRFGGAPFVGSWGTFATEIRLETPEGLRLLYHLDGGASS